MLQPASTSLIVEESPKRNARCCLGTSNLDKANSGEPCRRMSLAAMFEGPAPRNFCLTLPSPQQTRFAPVHSRLHGDEDLVLDSDRFGRLRRVRAGST